VTTNRRNRKLNVLRAIVLAIAIGFVIYGAFQGEFDAVLRKASIICMECIGVG
jgi:hypothetical protein